MHSQIILENTDTFSYPYSVITTNGVTKEDIPSRITKAKGAFAQLNKIGFKNSCFKILYNLFIENMNWFLSIKNRILHFIYSKI